MKKYVVIIASLLFVQIVFAQTTISIPNPETWCNSDLKPYVGETVTFTTPFYINNNYSGLRISPRRFFSPTNQALPMSQEYEEIIASNNCSVVLNNVGGYHRNGEIIRNLTVRVSSTGSLQYVSGDFTYNTRKDLEKGIPNIDIAGQHTLLVCAFNLRYYLVENLGTGYGPRNQSESDQQHKKIMDALTHINADIYGFLEIEQGQSALKKIADALTTATGRQYKYIDDGGSSYGSYTKSGYVYCAETVSPDGTMKNNNIGVQNRKKVLAFKQKSNDESFIFFLNHFKAKSGTGSGDDEDKGDGQGAYNGTRVREAKSVLEYCETMPAFYCDNDILVMGDLNAYAYEDPITTLVNGGLTDLHRAFHADTSYSYVYHGEAGYLDHALANDAMLKQVTGMAAYHINSDEDNNHSSYNTSSDCTMFRSSDHDPVIVGLALGQSIEIKNASAESCDIEMHAGKPLVHYADGGYYRIYDISANLISEGKIVGKDANINAELTPGFYIMNVYVENTIRTFKFIINK